MPSSSSYSRKASFQSRKKTPFRVHSWKYLCKVLGAPNPRGASFHWQPVRRTYKIPSNSRRASARGRPPCFPFGYFGISGSVRSHSASETRQLRGCLRFAKCASLVGGRGSGGREFALLPIPHTPVYG